VCTSFSGSICLSFLSASPEISHVFPLVESFTFLRRCRLILLLCFAVIVDSNCSFCVVCSLSEPVVVSRRVICLYFA